MNKIIVLAVANIIGLIFLSAANRSDAADFYSGKTIRFVVGAPAGGGYDTYTRAIARHLGKHIPGNPSMVVAIHNVFNHMMRQKSVPDTRLANAMS